MATIVFRIPHGLQLSENVVPPLLTTLIYAFVWNDAAETPGAARAIWERFLERAWAVIIIDFVTSIVFESGWEASFSADPLALIGGFLAMTIVVLTTFADASATVDDDATVWTLVPRAFVKSVVTAVRPRVLIRAVVIFSLWLVVITLQDLLAIAFLKAGVPNPEFWASVPIGTVCLPPIAALTVLVYRDAVLAPPTDPASWPMK